MNNITLRCAKSIALPTKVINLSLSSHSGSRNLRFHLFFFPLSFFLSSLREKESARRSTSSRNLDIDGRTRSLVFSSLSLSLYLSLSFPFSFSPFSLFFSRSLFFLSLRGPTRAERWAGSIDGGMILCNEGCGIFMPERAGARRPPRHTQARRGRCLSLLPLGVYSLCIAGG